MFGILSSVLGLVCLIHAVSAGGCNSCSLTLPNIELGAKPMAPFSNDQIIGTTEGGCLIRNLTCTSNLPDTIFPLISLNDDRSGVIQGVEASLTIQLICDGSEDWTYTQDEYTVVIDNLQCMGDYIGL